LFVILWAHFYEKGVREMSTRFSALFLALTLILTPEVLAQRPERVRVLIGLNNTPTAADEAMVTFVGGEIIYRYHLVNAMAILVPQSAIPGLRQNPNVAVIEPDLEVEITDSELDAAWGVKHIGSGTLHDAGIKGTSVRVAVVDTGIDYTHPDLSANFVGGFDFVNNDPDPMDDHGHGTHIAGIIAAMDDDNGVIGVAPEAALYGIKVLGSAGSGSWSGVIAGIEWATDNGIQVTNNSYSGGVDPGTIVKAAFDNSYALGVLHIASAGNSGNCDGTGETTRWPARYPSVVATTATDSRDLRACFSSTGLDVELSAPGVSVNSTYLGGGYRFLSGTSMASPHVVGSAALVIGNGTTTNVEVRQVLVDTANDLGPEGFDPLYGYGLIDPVEAVDGAPPPSPHPPNTPPEVTITSPPDGSVFTSGTLISFSGVATDTQDGDITESLVWASVIDGLIGRGGSFSFVLNEGEHIVIAQAADSGFMTGDDRISIIVLPTATTASVTSIGYGTIGGRLRDEHIVVTAILRDEFGEPVVGASVEITLSSEDSSWSLEGNTDEIGQARFHLNNAPAGCYTSKVSNVIAFGLTWDGETPANLFCRRR
jgi:subtilisin family serine protease